MHSKALFEFYNLDPIGIVEKHQILQEMIYMYMYMYLYKYMYICIYIYICISFLVESNVFRHCQRDPSCRTRKELSNAIVKSYFRLTGVELWPFPFRNATPSVTSLIVV